MPNLETIKYAGFNEVPISRVSFPKLTYLDGGVGYSGATLEYVDYGLITSIPSYSFPNNSYKKLKTIILRNTSSVVKLNSNNVFYKTDDLRIYVPDNLVNDYKNDSAWNTYSNYIKPISEVIE